MSRKSESIKEEILSGLVETRAAILNEISQLSPHAWDTVFLGEWSARDLLAHLAGWDFTNLQAIRAVQKGKLPKFYVYYDRDWKTYNAGLVAKYKRDDFHELLELVRDSHHQLIEYLQTVAPEAFTRDFGVRSRGIKVTIARLLQAELGDERAHLKQVREFRAQL
jgi:hypothetical protein